VAKAARLVYTIGVDFVLHDPGHQAANKEAPPSGTSDTPKVFAVTYTMQVHAAQPLQIWMEVCFMH
jgi:hypothetical protein